MHPSKVLTAAVGATALVLFSIIPARADVVDDVLYDVANCKPVPVNPVLIDFKVTGSGGIESCKVAPLGFTICLDYMQTIQPHSCRHYPPFAMAGETESVPCIPGVWSTTVIIEGPQSVTDTVLTYLQRHSNPSIFVKDCVIADDPEP